MAVLLLVWSLCLASHILNTRNAGSHLVLVLGLALGAVQPASATNIVGEPTGGLFDILCDLAKALQVHMEKLALDLSLLPCNFQVTPESEPSVSPHGHALDSIYAVIPTPSYSENPAGHPLPVGVDPPNFEDLVHPYSLVLVWFILMVWAFVFPTWGWSRWTQTSKERIRRAAVFWKHHKRVGYSLKDLEVDKGGALSSVGKPSARDQIACSDNDSLGEDHVVREILLNYPCRMTAPSTPVDQRAALYSSIQSAYHADEAYMKKALGNVRGRDVPFRIKLMLQSGSERYVYYSPDDAPASDMSEDECAAQSAREAKYLALEDVPALDDETMIDERSMLACGDLAYAELALGYVGKALSGGRGGGRERAVQ
ncbi:hypothetical protein MD484_g5053, partial [Candolleomyces efflorescens]